MATKKKTTTPPAPPTAAVGEPEDTVDEFVDCVQVGKATFINARRVSVAMAADAGCKLFGVGLPASGLVCGVGLPEMLSRLGWTVEPPPGAPQPPQGPTEPEE